MIYIYIYHDSTWKHLRQPCANLAPSLCFAGFPCVTPHNELVKSYKSVGCVPPRLKFLFRTFDRLPYVFTIYTYLYTYLYIYIYVSICLCNPPKRNMFKKESSKTPPARATLCVYNDPLGQLVKIKYQEKWGSPTVSSALGCYPPIHHRTCRSNESNIRVTSTDQC